MMGDKITAKTAMAGLGVPLVPGSDGALADLETARAVAETVGYPVLIKAAAGGGGRGMKVAHSADELEEAWRVARTEARAAFGNDEVYLEKYLDRPRHIELQILADKHGHVLHVGERDCSLQRRHQKLLEEAPAAIGERVRAGIRAAGIAAARAIAYDSVGTIECLVAGGEFFFLEMNTRIQVEHTVSEMISGIDLVREQILIAAGRPLDVDQAAIDAAFRGHAIEVRVNAEDPADGFRPAPGTIVHYEEPGGFGVRVDSAASPGFTITADYDSMIAKLIVWARDRDEARARLRRAIDEYRITGVPTTLGLLRALIDHPPVVDSSYGTQTLEAFAATGAFGNGGTSAVSDTSVGAGTSADAGAPPDTIRVEVNDRLYRVRFVDLPLPAANDATPRIAKKPATAKREREPQGDDVLSPMHGVVVDIPVVAGAIVAQGDIVAVIEAMKMMNEIRAHRAGTIATVHVAAGATVEARTALVSLARA
jgi:acetyl/propionyl-CoA carboxylase alpha subunit